MCTITIGSICQTKACRVIHLPTTAIRLSKVQARSGDRESESAGDGNVQTKLDASQSSMHKRDREVRMRSDPLKSTPSQKTTAVLWKGGGIESERDKAEEQRRACK